jgi:GH43 family beta-xylosidase
MKEMVIDLIIHARDQLINWRKSGFPDLEIYIKQFLALREI